MVCRPPRAGCSRRARCWARPLARACSIDRAQATRCTPGAIRSQALSHESDDASVQSCACNVVSNALGAAITTREPRTRSQVVPLSKPAALADACVAHIKFQGDAVMNSKISYAVAAILGGASLGASVSAVAADPAADNAEAGGDMLAEITVTAQRRTQ